MKRTEILCYILFTGAVLVSPARKNFVNTTDNDRPVIESKVFPVGLQSSREALIQTGSNDVNINQNIANPGITDHQNKLYMSIRSHQPDKSSVTDVDLNLEEAGRESEEDRP